MVDDRRFKVLRTQRRPDNTLAEFTFRSPVPAYRHSCAQFLKLRGQIKDSQPPKGAPCRPASDLETPAKVTHTPAGCKQSLTKHKEAGRRQLMSA